MTVEIAKAPPDFDRWEDLHALLMASFAYMADRIDPPSSLLRMDASALAGKAKSETLVLATEGGRIAGCVFLRAEPDALYVGKLAVGDAFRGRGIARRLFAIAEDEARAADLPFLELQTRIELTENHETFSRLGFVRTGATAHDGYDRPTSVTMRKPVTAHSK
ncbi:GNAT family N-acetyltransferase [Oricola nitratireducens]|uniref:GNAT family N-acetyltransferase n=1 Tax=Oricola nitratireducens TaxID=2775868 RepID=UPI0018681471|nr:GNAT family N-acetyltransferase [Oricola nitratireducens]